MAVLTVQDAVNTGLNATYASAASGGDEFANTGTEIVHVKNGSGGSVTVTVATTQEVEGLAVADVSVAIPAGEDRFIGPFRQKTFNASDDNVDVTYSSETSVTLAVIKVTGVG